MKNNLMIGLIIIALILTAMIERIMNKQIIELTQRVSILEGKI